MNTTDTSQAEPVGGHGFGTAPVFLASISTILGAILFLRFGYSVAHVGVFGTILIVIVGHAVTIPTALAIAEISTNRRVEGGGEYFIISRSFGATVGGAIGISLYLSQAVSVAFYMITFAEAFRPLESYFTSVTGLAFDPRYVSFPATLGLVWVVLTRGATIGVRALWVVVGVLAVSLAAFFLGGAPDGVDASGLTVFDRIDSPDPFIVVFAIVFPAFTGMTAGVGLSGDLANPGRSIPLGVIGATVIGVIVYILVALKLGLSVPSDMLAEDQLIMARIAVWGPLIPLGLACATLSSAIGSILVAPRTLQALAGDRLAPFPRITRFLAAGAGANEPRNATLVTGAIALVTVAAGNVDAVARLISMFFMVTYGALCTISALEHFAARPSFRPTFRSTWYLSLIGAVMCGILMLQMDPLYAAGAAVVMILLYRMIRASRGADDLAAIFSGVMTQATRFSQIKLQASVRSERSDEWRPSLIMVNDRTFGRTAPIQFFSWLTHRYGVGTYLHYIEGRLNRETYSESRRDLEQLIDLLRTRRSAIYADTIISPSKESAVAQALQLPGISGMENNTLLTEFSLDDPDEVLEDIRSSVQLASATQVNSLILRHGDRFFGQRRVVDIWLTVDGYRNANLMILLAYILLGNKDWHEGTIRLSAAFPRNEFDRYRDEVHDMITADRLPISAKNLRLFPVDPGYDFEALVAHRSSDADLVMLGRTETQLREQGIGVLRKHPTLLDMVFVIAEQPLLIE